LPSWFYARDTLAVAHDLIGKVLVHATPSGTTSGTIVEVEAYVGEDDPACHAAAGFTARNAPLYGPPGRAYVYLNYGIHYLVNAVTQPEGAPAAVLIRALEPLDGLDLMRRRRAVPTSAGPGGVSQTDLCRGPGNLSRALGISLKENRCDLTGARLYVVDRMLPPVRVAWSPRIGIRRGACRPWRCYVPASRCVSGPPQPDV
jgi:DNA-3-methyladenine glycosylase